MSGLTVIGYDQRRVKGEPSPTLPSSATHGIVALSGFVGFAASLVILLAIRPFSDTIFSAFFLLAAIASSVFAVDLLWAKFICAIARGSIFHDGDLRFAGSS